MTISSTAPRTKGASITLESLTKSYGTMTAVSDVSIDIRSGEFISLLGPSGSGKTTTLKMIAGFEIPDAGMISIDGKRVDDISPQKRGLGFVFQNYALFPNLTVAKNLAYPLELRKVPKNEIKSRVLLALSTVDLDPKEFADRSPQSLSGGQQQRVALARALIYEPRALLMDEPLGALDRRLRETMVNEFRRLHQNSGTTIIYVTHDQDEAMTMSDRVAVFAQGRVQQLGAPNELYEKPANEFVAGFLGDSNLFPVVSSEAGWLLEDNTVVPGEDVGAETFGTKRALLVRPEKLRLEFESDGFIRGRVSDVVFIGDHIRTVLDTPVGEVVVKTYGGTSSSMPERGSELGLSWDESAATSVAQGMLG